MSRIGKICIQNPEPRINELKLQICYKLKSAWWRRNWNQTQAALYSGASRASMSRVDRLRIEELTVSQLFRYLASAAPEFELLISL